MRPKFVLNARGGATSIQRSRRRFLSGVASGVFAGTVLGRQRDQTVFAYVGTYSSPQGPEGSQGHGKGIHLYRMNPSDGVLKRDEIFPNDSNPAWLAFDPSRTHLYSANEITNYNGTRSGSVSAYSVDRGSGRLALLNTVSSEGAGPAHLSVHPSGKYVLVANYAGGSIAVLPIQAGGGLGAASDALTDAGPVGPVHANSAPTGSFAISGHDRPHAHMIQSDASGDYVFSVDLGLDRILVWKLNLQTGKLSPGNPPFVQLPAGDGPRHFVIHPNGRWFYSLQEEASTIVAFDYDAAHGTLTAKQALSTLPADFSGTNFTSEIRISTDGRFVYAANRLHNSIALFSVGGGGELAYVGEAWTRGDYPRSFTLDPSGKFLYCCNQRSDAIATFRVDTRTGGLTFADDYTDVGTPGIIVFLT